MRAHLATWTMFCRGMSSCRCPSREGGGDFECCALLAGATSIWPGDQQPNTRCWALLGLTLGRMRLKDLESTVYIYYLYVTLCCKTQFHPTASWDLGNYCYGWLDEAFDAFTRTAGQPRCLWERHCEAFGARAHDIKEIQRERGQSAAMENTLQMQQ